LEAELLQAGYLQVPTLERQFPKLQVAGSIALLEQAVLLTT